MQRFLKGDRCFVHPPLPLILFCLVILGALVIGAAKALGQQGAFLAQFYMLTPAVAAILTRLFFYKPGFRDAKLGFGKWTDYFKFWGLSIGITVLSYLMFTLLGAVTWDPSGQSFLDRLDGQFRQMGQDMNESLPPGMTPRMMLLLYLLGGLTILNILPGIIMGFGEEFGHRGFMFIELQKINPRTAIVVGGIIWFAWHLPIGLAVPQADPVPLWQMAVNVLAMGIGSICAFAYFAFVYVTLPNHDVCEDHSPADFMDAFADQLRDSRDFGTETKIVNTGAVVRRRPHHRAHLHQ